MCVRLRRAGGGGHARVSNFVVVWEAQRREEIAREKGEGGVLTPLKLRSSSSPVADLSITGVDSSSRQWSHLPRSKILDSGRSDETKRECESEGTH